MSYTPLEPTHAAAFHRLCVDEHIRRYLLDGLVVPSSWADAEIARSQSLFASRQVGLWLVCDGAETIGFCGFRVFETMGPEPQLLYAFVEAHTGKGHATRACRWLLERTHELGWERVSAAVDAPNTASIRVLEHNEFEVCGHVPGEHGGTLLFERPATAKVATDTHLRLHVAHTWDGHPLESSEQVNLEITMRADELIVSVDAPFHDDPPPPGAPGRTPQLWEHEVVELMLLGAGDRYLEIELAPHGHFLVLTLSGRRQIVHQAFVIHYDAHIDGARWSGTARIPRAWIPVGCDRLNAYAIHGVGSARRYLAWQPSPAAPEPDFHCLESFAPLPE